MSIRSVEDVIIDVMTEAYATVKIPAEIGPNQHGSMRC